MTITPGDYLRLRRLAAGLSIDQVAHYLDSEPHVDERARAAWLGLVEADAQPVSLTTLVALKRIFTFDRDVIFALERIRQGSAETPPRICRVCACSEHDACVGEGRKTCWWVGRDICAPCARGVATTAEAAAA